MHPIPSPQVLDPDRVLDNDRGELTADHQARAELLRDALHESCAYARQLWNALVVAREYLYDSLPSDPRHPGEHPHVSATPTGPEDSEGWDKWIDTYSGITSVLCGPHGDSGYGIGEARDAAQLRRNAPNVRIAARYVGPTAAPPAGPDNSRDTGTATPTTRAFPHTRSGLRTAALIAIAVLAGRWLPTRQRTARP